MSKEIPYKNICLICQVAMCCPGTNAPERFSIMNNTWTNERNRMTVPTLKMWLVTRSNFDDGPVRNSTEGCQQTNRFFFSSNKYA